MIVNREIISWYPAMWAISIPTNADGGSVTAIAALPIRSPRTVDNGALRSRAAVLATFAPRYKRMAAMSLHDRACRAMFDNCLQGLARTEIRWKNWKPIHELTPCERRSDASTGFGGVLFGH
jgi:hypothetical protein